MIRFGLSSVAGVAMMYTACGGRGTSPQPRYLPLAEVETVYGSLISAGNHPTPYQHGTGQRIGLFKDSEGVIWGLPLALSREGTALACASQGLHDAKGTDTLPTDSVVVGTTNEPNGWRGGSGDLELLLRDNRGEVHVKRVHGALVPAGTDCASPNSPGSPLNLYYYRLNPASESASK
jgi:hypothetical protein